MDPLGLKGRERRRGRRVNLLRTVRGSVDLRIDVQVVDLSPDGVMIEHSATLAPGKMCVLMLPPVVGGARLKAFVAWSCVSQVCAGPSGDGGLRFRSGLHFPGLAAAVEVAIRKYLIAAGGRRPRPMTATVHTTPNGHPDGRRPA